MYDYFLEVSVAASKSEAELEKVRLNRIYVKAVAVEPVKLYEFITFPTNAFPHHE